MPNKLLVQAMVRTLRQHHYSIPEGSYHLWPPRIRGFSVKDWEEAEKAVEELERRYGLDAITPVEREKFYRLLNECVYAKVAHARSRAFLGDSIRESLDAIEEALDGRLSEELHVLRGKIAELTGSKTRSLGVKDMIKGLKQPEAALDFGYPGYLKAGLLTNVIRMKNGVLNEDDLSGQKCPQGGLQTRTATSSGN